VTALAPPVFVVGCFRGGTTLLERLLLCHPDLAGPGFETQLFSRLRYGRAVDHPAEHEAFSAGVEVEGDAIAAFAAAGDRLARRGGARRWVEKSPEHVYHARTIVSRFPGARIVHIVRDPRDVVSSILHTPWVVPHARTRDARVVAGAVLWELMTREGLRLFVDPTVASAVLGVRFESLVCEPKAEMRRIAAFLELPDDERSIASWLEGSKEKLRGNSLIEPELRGVAASPVGRWRDRRYLTGRELALVQYLIGPTLVRAGYELAPTEPLPRRARARAATAKCAWLAVRGQRYAKAIGKGVPPHFAADVAATLVPLLRLEARSI
jgi:hypothetical protein